MWLWILLLVYIVGFAINFWALEGFEDFKSDPEETTVDVQDRMVGIALTLCMSLMWPLLWVCCIFFWLLGKVFFLS